MSNDRESGHPRGTLRQLVRSNLVTIVVSVAALVFMWLLVEVWEGELTRIDTYAYQLFVVELRRDWLTPVMRSISELAQPVVLVLMLLTIEAFASGRKPALCATVNLAGAFALNQLLKHVVQRPRPDGFRLIAASGYSFPSGHSMVAMAFYGLLAWMVWRHYRTRAVRNLCVAGYAMVVVLIGISRIYLGVHYATDVIAGFCVSIIWLVVYTRLIVPAMFGTDAVTPARASSDDGR